MGGKSFSRGFTLIELLVVMAIISLLLAVAVPRYFSSLDKSREAVLRQNLAVMREAIDRYHGDLGRYPERLEDLVSRNYLRRIPADPITEQADSWVAVAGQADRGGIRDVKSGAPGTGRDGTPYGDW